MKYLTSDQRNSRIGMAFASIVLLSATGCSSLMNSISGSSSQFACRAPEGVTCASMQGVYANSLANNLPEQRHEANQKATLNAPKTAVDVGDVKQVGIQSRGDGSPIVGTALVSGSAIRSRPVERRLWIAPWKDADGDLNDQRHVYMTITDGDWLLSHNRTAIRNSNTQIKGRASISSAAVQQSGSDDKEGSLPRVSRTAAPTNQAIADSIRNAMTGNGAGSNSLFGPK